MNSITKILIKLKKQQRRVSNLILNIKPTENFQNKKLSRKREEENLFKNANS
jgi:hypothetical protein